MTSDSNLVFSFKARLILSSAGHVCTQHDLLLMFSLLLEAVLVLTVS